ncbi:NAD-dependent epimerase/dehydratase family protein [Pajaroellobacter abortibovis]|uniref:NAD-dependent epimerase/dehydratase domain-containing protein n=1 Tax=Pajaroellobacter abortibovis TaxID=1882918 RepID=A0A1L6MW34_9BACT|nr:NAD-dependent epimerase/dehydratase family protein [Pajaroellobacter abortibovis]APR99648.1 hypothetical protein BCY86_02385 [Pajaroellobacter abortibovis]
MHWLVTGGVGFIGFHLTRALLQRGDRVTIADDFSNAPYPTYEKRRNQRDLETEFGHSVQIREVCITDRITLEPLFKEIDGIIHLAGLAGVRSSFQDPCRYLRVNIEGTTNLLELAKLHSIDQILIASSSSVYGDSTPLPAKEEAVAILPQSPYAASKRASELVAYSLMQGLPRIRCSALRFFTVYGPRQRPEMAITLFCRALIQQKPLPLFGNGSMRRDFTHVDDIVRGILAASENAPQGFSIYNLGSGSPITLTDLTEQLEHTTGRKALIEREEIPRGDVQATFADITRARQELGWEPRISLSEGLKTVFAWVQEHG